VVLDAESSFGVYWVMDSELFISTLFRSSINLDEILLGFLHEQLFREILPASVSSWSSILVPDLVRFGETHCTAFPEGWNM